MKESKIESLTENTHSSQRTRLIVIFVVIVSLLHHIDHILRADHSGWPFQAEFTPFTISVVVAYAIAAFVYFARGYFWSKFWLVVAGYAFTQAAHIFIETPDHQYVTWATNASPVTSSLGEPNLLNIASPAAGAYAVVLSLVLSAALIILMISTYLDARQADTSPN